MNSLLDIRTLMVCMGGVNLMLAIIMVTLSATRRTYPGFHLWTLAYVSCSVGSVLIALRGVVPDFLSLIVGNFGIVGFGVILARGMAVFLRYPQARAFEALSLALLLVGLVWTSYIEVSAAGRIAVVMLVFLAFNLRIGWVVWRGGNALIGGPDWFVISMIFGGAITSLARLVLAFTSPPPATFMDQGPAQGVTILLFTMVSIGSMCAAVSLNSRRLEHDLSLSERALQNERSALERAVRELSELATRDGLTGLYNRRFFDEVLEREWRRLTRTRSPLSLVLLDIDHFKEFNDRYGHQKGDEALAAVARVVKSGVKRTSDVGARYGGEEFALVLPETAAAGARGVAERIAMEIRELGIRNEGSNAQGARSLLTVSLGVATVVPSAGTVPQTLLAMADEALYRSKREGRNRITEASAQV